MGIFEAALTAVFGEGKAEGKTVDGKSESKSALLTPADVVSIYRKYTQAGEAPLTTEGWSRTGGAAPNAEPKTLTELHEYAREQALHAELTTSASAVKWANQAWDNISTIATNKERLAEEVLFVHLLQALTVSFLFGFFGCFYCFLFSSVVPTWDKLLCGHWTVPGG